MIIKYWIDFWMHDFLIFGLLSFPLIAGAQMYVDNINKWI